MSHRSLHTTWLGGWPIHSFYNTLFVHSHDRWIGCCVLSSPRQTLTPKTLRRALAAATVAVVARRAAANTDALETILGVCDSYYIPTQNGKTAR